MTDNTAGGQIHAESFRSTLEAGRSAINAAVLINGGACVALLALIGNVWGDVSAVQRALFVSPLARFAFGVLAAGISFGTLYITQSCFTKNKNRAGAVFNVITILCVSASWGLFVFGVLASGEALLTP